MPGILHPVQLEQQTVAFHFSRTENASLSPFLGRTKMRTLSMCLVGYSLVALGWFIQADEREDRWALLTEAERAKVHEITRSLRAGKGIALPPADYVFACHRDNIVFFKDDLAAAGKKSCGHLIDAIAKDFGLELHEKLSLRYDLDSYITVWVDNRPHESAQAYYAQRSQIYFRGETKGMTPTTDRENEFVRLAILGQVISRKVRLLSDEEVKFLRDYKWAKDELAEYLKSGSAE